MEGFEIVRVLFIVIGFFFVGLGVVGAFVPGLPTVVFMLVALGCFAKSSKKFHNWLFYHPIFGEQLQLWKKHQVIPPVAKIAAITSMSLSGGYLIFFYQGPGIISAVAILFMLWGAYYILTKPSRPGKGER